MTAAKRMLPRLTFPPRVIHVILYGVLLLLLVNFVYFSIAAARRTSHSYVVLYTSAQLVREGVDFSRLYNDRWFAQQTARYDHLYRDIYRPHNPVTALMLLPLSDLDYAKSRVVWIMFNVAFLTAGSLRMLRELHIRGVYLPITIMLILLYNPLHVNLELGQSYILMFVFMVAAWVSYRRGDNRVLGIALGLMFILKTAGVFLWLLLILQRRWSALAWGIITAGLFALLSLPFVGIEAWFTYVREVSYFNGQPFLTVTAYQTHTSLFGHLFTYDANWNTAPVLDMPLLASALTWFTNIALVGLSAIIGLHRTQDPSRNDITFAIFAIVSVLIVPLALDYHYMLLMLPMMILVTQRWSSRQAKLVLLLGVALLSTAIAYRQPALAVGWWALLAYPKLYGALLLWGLALKKAKIGTSGVFEGEDESLRERKLE